MNRQHIMYDPETKQMYVQQQLSPSSAPPKVLKRTTTKRQLLTQTQTQPPPKKRVQIHEDDVITDESESDAEDYETEDEEEDESIVPIKQQYKKQQPIRGKTKAERNATRKPSAWVTHVKKYASTRGIRYADALMMDDCKNKYHASQMNK